MEMASADLGDLRRSRRLGLIVEALVANPGKSLPKALVSTAALEATYRFMSNRAVTPEAIAAPHVAATLNRMQGQTVLAIHDTTQLEFSGEDERDGLGPLSAQRQGFLAHVCLAVDATSGAPLGVLGSKTWARENPPGRKKRATYQFKQRETKESDRWGELVGEVDEMAAHRAQVIHVMDREADSYRLLAQMVAAKSAFVVRASHVERRLVDGRTLEASADDVRLQLIREVPLSKRAVTDRRRGNHPMRMARRATLLIGTTSIQMKGSWAVPVEEAPELKLNLVRVWEPEPPDGEHPIEWLLLTSLPVSSAAEIEFVIDTYRRRWLIEELFKALKTGCQFQKLQLESLDALLNALAIMLPVAARLLALRHLAQYAPERPASDVLTGLQIRVLRAYEHTKKLPLVTARDAMLAVARLGGHIKNNGDPGWQVLGRGFEDLLALEQGARLALGEM